jgi:pimeloyl-ACP methyl ester carboxylesterase
LPGFGGMQSFYKIGKQPTIDNYADYLAAFIKMRYKRRRLVIIGISFGFVVATRMLQRYPELVSKVDFVVSVAGFMHRDDFAIGPAKRRMLGVAARLLAVRPLAWIVRYTALALPATYNAYAKIPASTTCLLAMEPFAEHRKPEAEKNLWQLNDLSTHCRVMAACMKVDNCRSTVALPVWYLYPRQGGCIDEAIAKQHMLIAYQACHILPIKAASVHSKVPAGEYGSEFALPAGLRKALA